MPKSFSLVKYRDALEDAYDQFEFLRRNGARADAEFQGRARSRDQDLPADARNFRPINALQKVVATYLPLISAYEVRTKCTPRVGPTKAEALIRSELLNQQIERMRYVDVDREVCLDTILDAFGCSKTGVSLGAQAISADNNATDPGELWFKRIAPKDVLVDPNATSMRSARWIADRYVADKARLIEILKEAGLSDKAALVASIESLGARSDSVEDRGVAGAYAEDSETVEEIVLWDIAIFDGSDVYVGTMAHWADQDINRWVVEPEPWQGFEDGPYELVSLCDVRDQPVGMGIANQVMELHLAMRKVGEKVMRQIIETKRVKAYRAAQKRDADAIQAAGDEKWVAVQDPKFFADAVSGGMLPEMIPGVDYLAQMLNQATANVDLAGGRGRPNGSSTATAWAITNERVTTAFSDFKERHQLRRKRDIRKMSWWIDQWQNVRKLVSVEDVLGPLELLFDSNTRRGVYTDFSYDVFLTTASTIDPNMRKARMADAMAAMERFLPVVVQTGGDVQALAEEISNEFEWPGFRKVFPGPTGMLADAALAQVAQPIMPSGVRPAMGGSQFGRNVQRRPVDQARSDLAPSVPRGV